MATTQAAAAGPPPDPSNPNILRDTFSKPFAEHSQTWDALYQHDFHPWDRGGPSLALADLLSQRTDLVPAAQAPGASRRTALVPGCGRGHDVLLLQSYGYDVVGLDVSADGIRRAQQNVQEYNDQGKVVPVTEGTELGEASFVVADFFDENWSNGMGSDSSGKFDLIFDYTFLCALPPDIRPQWAKRMSQLLSSRGHLVCLEFPSGKPISEQGPPWGLNPEVYEALLGHPGVPLTYNDDGTVLDAPSEKPDHGALHRLCLVKPVRTHKAGTNEDGSVRDFISVWSH